MSADATLEADHVDFAYHADRPVLRAVSARLRAGSLTVVVGPNGAGKSTLVRLLAGVRAPRRGRVLHMSRPLGGLSAAARAGAIAYVPQRADVAFPFTVRRVVEMGRHASGDRVAGVDQALERFGLADRADDVFGELSVGQQQRATLARAFAQLEGAVAQGPCLLADEPIAAMDPLHALDAMEALQGLARAGVAVLVVLHDLSMAARFADEAVVLDGSGRVAATGAAGKVLDGSTLEPVFGVAFERLTGSATALVPLRRGARPEPIDS